jgi:nicotinamidase/pyrazinamidase
VRTVFVDVDTQFDFVVPSGALYVPGAERLIARFEQLNRFAAGQGIVVISTTDAHAEDDAEFAAWPPHCVSGTWGQRKPEGTLIERRVPVPSAKAAIAVEGAAQILIEKQELDCFSNTNLPDLLRTLSPDRYVVYGVVTEYCVECAVMGLLKTGKPVELVEDAIQSLDSAKASRTLAAFAAAGGVVTRSASILA